MSIIRDRRPHRLVSRALVAVSVSLFLRSTVLAAEPSPSPEARRQAQKDLAAGQRLLERGQFEAALVRLQASYGADPSGGALMGMGEAERRLDHPAEAYRDYERAVSGPSGDLLPSDREAAQRALAELAAVTGTVKPALSEPGAACTVDGRPLTSAAATVAGTTASGSRRIEPATIAPVAVPAWTGRLLAERARG